MILVVNVANLQCYSSASQDLVASLSSSSTTREPKESEVLVRLTWSTSGVATASQEGGGSPSPTLSGAGEIYK